MLFQSVGIHNKQTQKFMHSQGGSTLLDEVVESTRGHSATTGDTVREGRARGEGYEE
jgi:hypothetical protein